MQRHVDVLSGTLLKRVPALIAKPSRPDSACSSPGTPNGMQ
jgi:hypothetical protein